MNPKLPSNNNNNNSNSDTNSNNNHKNKLQRRNFSLGGGGVPKNNDDLVEPSIFRYTCRGRLTLDSLRRPHHAGICQGFQSPLEHAEHWQTTTRDDAVNAFQQRSTLLGEAPPTPGDGVGTTTPTASTSKEGFPSAHALQTVYLSNVLVYPNLFPTPNNNDNHKDNILNDDAAPREEWSCYGTTEVDLLVLRKSKLSNAPDDDDDNGEDNDKDTIAAVSPYCSPGMTTRDVIPNQDQRDRTSTIRLGFLEILYQSTLSNDDDDIDLEEWNHNNNKNANRNRNQQQQQQETSSPTGNQPQPDAGNNSGKRRNTKSSEDDDDKMLPTSMLGKFGASSHNIWNHMQLNAKLIWETLGDDFPHRTMEASHKIVAEFPRTYDRTVGLMKKVATFWQDDDDDDDNDDNHNGGGRFP